MSYDPIPFRLVIEGVAAPAFLPELVRQANNMTPKDGGFTLEVGASTTPCTTRRAVRLDDAGIIGYRPPTDQDHADGSGR